MTKKHFLLSLAFCGCFFLGSFSAAEAQARCSDTEPCPSGQMCNQWTRECMTVTETPHEGSPLLVPGGSGGSEQPGGRGGTLTPGGSGGSLTPGGTGGDTTGGSGTLVNPLQVDSLEGLLNLFLQAVIRIGTIVLILMLIWVGFLFVAARGNEEKIRTARAALMWTIIGGLILLGARGLSEVIQSTATTLGS